MANTTTIQLGQTVYGASINWDTGVMTVTDVIYDLGTPTWNRSTSYAHPFFYTDLLGYKKGAEVIGISSIYNVIASTTAPDFGGNADDGSLSFHASPNANQIYVRDDRYTDATAFKTAVTGQTVVYELATPTTLQLTPTQLELLKGYNKVTIESGTITLDYVAKAISGNDEEIAPLVGDKATKSYAVNDFIERADGLYRVTAPIASGASFTANNTVKMSIGEALTYLYNK